jgi:hypothetical protein
MIEHLAVFEPDRNGDRAKFERQAAGAVDRAVKLNLIRKLRGSEERYEVSPTLKLLFPAEEIQQLARTYARLSEQAQSGELAVQEWDSTSADEDV